MYYKLDENILAFPHPESARFRGALAMGGEITVQRLQLSYSYGIFPWYNEGDPVRWYCPNPRFVIFPNKVKVAKSMRPYFNLNKYQVTYNQAFETVIRACQLVPRISQKGGGTWITEAIVDGYSAMHKMGLATSVEVWDGTTLVGGLYGVNIGKCFFGESMFSLKSNASKFGFISLAAKLEKEGYYIIDCQMANPYLKSLGGEFISGRDFQAIMRENILFTLSQY